MTRLVLLRHELTRLGQAPLSIPHDPAILFLAVSTVTAVLPFLLVTWGIERRMRA